LNGLLWINGLVSVVAVESHVACGFDWIPVLCGYVEADGLAALIPDKKCYING